MTTKKFSKEIVGISLMLMLLLAMPLGNAYSSETKSPSTWQPPKRFGITSVGTGSVGFQSVSALLPVFEEMTGVKFNVLPAAATMGRFSFIRKKQVKVGLLTAMDVLQGLVGSGEFKDRLGPQSVRTLWDCGAIDQGLGVRADSGIKTIADLRGKRVARIVFQNDQTLCRGWCSKRNSCRRIFGSSNSGQAKR